VGVFENIQAWLACEGSELKGDEISCSCGSVLIVRVAVLLERHVSRCEEWKETVLPSFNSRETLAVLLNSDREMLKKQELPKHHSPSMSFPPPQKLPIGSQATACLWQGRTKSWG